MTDNPNGDLGREGHEYPRSEGESDAGKALKNLMADIKTLMDFLLEQGQTIPAQTTRLYAQLLASAPETQVDEQQVSAAFEAYSQLASLAAPATPHTIQMSKNATFSARDGGVITFFFRAAVVSLLAFVVTAGWLGVPETADQATPAAKQAKGGDASSSAKKDAAPLASGQAGATSGTQAEKGSSPKRDPHPLLLAFNILFAASLGAVFYGLLRAKKYIKERTFSEAYDAVYKMRYLIGLVAGVAMGYYGQSLVKSIGSTKSWNAVQALGPGGLALVGGFASDAVSLLLRRVADILAAAVQGGSEEKINANKQKAETDATKKVEQQKKKQTQQLLKIRKALVDDGSPNEEARKTLDKALEEV